MSRILLALFVFFVAPISGNNPAIKGKQYVRHTTTARFIGGPISEKLLIYLTTKEDVPPPMNASTFGSNAMVITEDVKTVITRMLIPLNSTDDDNERYMRMLKKFLIDNKIDMSPQLDGPENFAQQIQDVADIENRLEQASTFRENLLSLLHEILVKNWKKLPNGNHVPLSHIYRLLQLRRIPIVELASLGMQLSTLNTQNQWITLLIEMEGVIPPYMKSCVTFLLESLQTGKLIISDVLSDTSVGNGLVKGLDVKKMSPLVLPRQFIYTIPKAHIEELGESTAALLATAREQGQMTPKLLRQLIASVPRNVATTIEELQVYSKMSQRSESEEEVKIIANVAKKAFEQFGNPPSEILRNILEQVTQHEFQGVCDYETLLRLFQLPRENYIVSLYSDLRLTP